MPASGLLLSATAEITSINQSNIDKNKIEKNKIEKNKTKTETAPLMQANQNGFKSVNKHAAYYIDRS